MSNTHSDPSGQQYDSWDPNPIIELGNAWITFGDLLDKQLGTMSAAQFNLADGAWLGDASVAMATAFGAMEASAQKVIISCWDTGEMINYFALLRSAQQATQARQQLEQMLLGIFSLLIGVIAPFLDIGALLGTLAEMIAELVGVADLVAAAAEELTSFIASAASFALDSVGVEADTMTVASWMSSIENVAASVAKFTIDYTTYNAVAEAAANGIAGLPVGPDQLSPIPTSAAGWGELAGIIALGGLAKTAGSVVGKGDKVAPEAEPAGGGIAMPTVRVSGAGSAETPDVGTAGGAGKITDGPAGSVTAKDASIANSGDIAHQETTFAGPGQRLGGTNTPTTTNINEARAQQLENTAHTNNLANLEENNPTPHKTPTTTTRTTHPTNTPPTTNTTNFTGPGQRLGGTNTPTTTNINEIRAQQLENTAHTNNLANLEEGNATVYRSVSRAPVVPRTSEDPRPGADTPGPTAGGITGSPGYRGASSPRSPGGLQIRDKSTGSSTMTIEPRTIEPSSATLDSAPSAADAGHPAVSPGDARHGAPLNLDASPRSRSSSDGAVHGVSSHAPDAAGPTAGPGEARDASSAVAHTRPATAEPSAEVTPTPATPPAGGQVEAAVQDARNQYGLLFDGSVPHEFFAFVAAAAPPLAHAQPGTLQGSDTVTRQPAEVAWQQWLGWARAQFPGTAPTRTDVTLAQAVDWIGNHVQDMAAQAATARAATAHIDRPTVDSARQYVSFHQEQARVHARNMILSDLGIDVQRLLGADTGLGAVHTVPGTRPDQLPTHAHGSATLPGVSRGAVVPGLYSWGSGTMIIDGQPRDPAAAAAWIRRWTSLTEAPGPVVLIGGGAGGQAGTGPGIRAYADALARDLGTTVLASAGTVLQAGEGGAQDYFSGTLVTGDDGALQLVRLGSDEWTAFTPDGQSHPVGTALGPVLRSLGVQYEPPEAPATAPTLWNTTVPARSQPGTGQAVYPPVPSEVQQAASALVFRWDHYPIVLGTGLAETITRYEEARDVAAVAHVLVSGRDSTPRPSGTVPGGGVHLTAAEETARELGRRRGVGPYGGLAGGSPTTSATLETPAARAESSMARSPAPTGDGLPGDEQPGSIPLAPLGRQRGEDAIARPTTADPVQGAEDTSVAGLAARAARAAEAAEAAEAAVAAARRQADTRDAESVLAAERAERAAADASRASDAAELASDAAKEAHRTSERLAAEADRTAAEAREARRIAADRATAAARAAAIEVRAKADKARQAAVSADKAEGARAAEERARASRESADRTEQAAQDARDAASRAAEVERQAGARARHALRSARGAARAAADAAPTTTQEAARQASAAKAAADMEAAAAEERARAAEERAEEAARAAQAAAEERDGAAAQAAQAAVTADRAAAEARAAEASSREAAHDAAEATKTAEEFETRRQQAAARAADAAAGAQRAAKAEAAKKAEAAEAAKREESVRADAADARRTAEELAEKAREARRVAQEAETAAAARAAAEAANLAEGGETGNSAGLSDTVATFGTRRDGAQPLSHIPTIPDDTMAWLQEQLIARVAGPQDDSEEFGAAMRAWLTPERLIDEWPRLRSTSGLPVGVPYRGARYPASLRLTLAIIGPGDPEMDTMTAGPPVALQRWKFGTTEHGNSMTSGNLRSGALGFSYQSPPDGGVLRSAAVAPRGTVTYGQSSAQVTATQLDRTQQQIRSKGSSRVFTYEMQWEMRPGDPTSELFAGRVPSDNWQPLAPPTQPSAPLRAWFPPYNATPGALPVADPADPATVPAPMELLRRSVPHFGVIAFPNHDVLLADVAASFPAVRKLSDDSREDLRKFLSESDISGNLPNAWAGHVPSPTLYDKSGNVVGYLRYRVDLADAPDENGNRITGPSTKDLVIDAAVVRAHGVSGSTQVTDSLGGMVQGQASLGTATAPGTEPGSGSRAGGPTVQLGYSHAFSHTLSYGGSVQESRDLRSNMPLFDVTPTVTFHFDLVRPVGAPLTPAPGTPLAVPKRYPVNMLVMSQADAEGKNLSEPRYLPPELLHLRRIPLSNTPLEVSGAEQLLDQAGERLRAAGFLPQTGPGRALAGLMAQATSEELLNNQRRFDTFRSQVSLRAGLDEALQHGASTWFQAGTERIRVQLNAARRYENDADPNAGVLVQRESKLVMLNYVGTILPGNEQFSSTPRAITGALGAQGTDLAGQGGTSLRSVSGDGVAAGQRAAITGSSAGTQHSDWVLSPYAEGSIHVTIPVQFTLRLLDDTADANGAGLPAHEGGANQSAGQVRLAVPRYQMLAEPALVRPPEPLIRRAEAGEQAPRNPAHGLYDGQVLRLPQGAIVNDVAGSAALIKAVHDTLNETGHAAPAEQVAPRLPGSWPTEQAAEEPAEQATEQQAAPQPQPATSSRSALMSAARLAGTLISLPPAVITPASMASEVITTSLSPASLKAHIHRQVRDSLVIEGAASYGGAADKNFTIQIRAHVTEVQPLPRPSALYSERWISSTNATESASTSQRSAGGGGSVDGDLKGMLLSGGSTARSVSTSTVAVGDSMEAYRVMSEDFGDAYRFRGTLVYVVEITQHWRNIVTEALGVGQHTETVVVEAPQGLEFALFANDFHAHPELLDLLPAGQRPAPRPEADRPLPPWFVQSGGVIGFGTVNSVEFDGGRDAFMTAVTDLVSQAAPGSVRLGGGLRSRVNQLTTGQGPAAIIGAGPESQTVFHWVHHGLAGPQLVELSVTAAPSPGTNLSQVRGRAVAKSASIENVLGHITGGAQLDAPGATMVSSTRARSHQSSASAFGTGTGFTVGPSVNDNRAYSVGPAVTSTREQRTWLRSVGKTSEYLVPYRYDITVTVRPLTESAVGWITGQMESALHWAGSATGLTGRPGSHGSSANVSTVVTGSVDASALLRFTNSEALGVEHPRPPAVPPHLLTSDPARALPAAPANSVVVDMEPLPQPVSDRLTGPRWQPARPVQVYYFGALRLLRQAIVDLNPALGAGQATRLTRSDEALSIIARDLIMSGKPTPLTPAGMSHITGTPGITGTTVTFRLYDPRPVSSSRDVSIDGIRTAVSALGSTGSRTTAPSLTLGGSQALTPDGAWTMSEPSLPLLGLSQIRGQLSQQSTYRLELLRVGTPAEDEEGNGLIGHQVQAVGVVEVTGPGHVSRWVVGEVRLRTTETPPGTVPALPRSAETAPDPMPALNLDAAPASRPATRTQDAPVQPTASGAAPAVPPASTALPPAPTGRRLPIATELEQHRFSLKDFAAARGVNLLAQSANADDQAVADLAHALADHIRDTVGQPRLSRAELLLETGSADLVLPGMDIAQRIADELRHRVLFIPAPGKKPTNICPPNTA